MKEPDNNKTTHASDDLWLTLSLAGQKYAVKSGYIDSIFQVQQKITEVPQTDPSVLGVITLRGMILPLVSMRLLFGLRSIDAEQEEFSLMLETRRNEHIRWVEEFKKCVLSLQDFSLADDPHLCAFGKWYDAYEAPSQTIKSVLSQIERPHEELHLLAKSYKKLQTQGNCSKEQLSQLIDTAEGYKTQIVELIDCTMEAFGENSRKMCIALSDGTTNVGLLVDEIHSAERISGIRAMNKQNCNRYTTSVGEMADGSHVILLDEEVLLNL
ncbi:chemotaxis protein CheW [Acidaminobacterium chupaoyuni]